MVSFEKIAKILRVDKDIVGLIEERFVKITGRKKVFEKIVEDNDFIISDRLGKLGLDKTSSAKEIYSALIGKMEISNHLLFDFFGKPAANKAKDWNRVLEFGRQLAGSPKGFFLKIAKAAEMLEQCPPINVLKTLEYSSVKEMLAKEDIFEIYSSLRFIEGAEWLNNAFFKQYENLKPEDFEEREIGVLALPEKWALLAQDFIKHKYHNVSHLKELGIIFVIPLALNISGEVIRNFSLILHYLNEIPFYSSLFRKFAKNKENFAANIISLLRGDVFDKQLPLPMKRTRWLVIQRYLAKDDGNDWRLFVPHINPEALHWERAARLLMKVNEKINGLATDMSFWQNLDWVGDYFKSDAGIDVLVSFNLVDTAMSLVRAKEMKKYFYHHEESLWNKIFIEYFGEIKMEELAKENIIKGWFEA